MNFSSRKPIDRRTLLRGAGAAIALPILDAMSPSLFASADRHSLVQKRMIFINLHLGFMADRFVPQKPGRDYKPSEYLKVIDPFRDDFTVITGTSHPGVNGAHTADVSFLTAAPDAASAAFRNSVSVDQIAAEKIGDSTRYAYLPLGLSGHSLSYSRSGANIPAITRATEIYKKLFVNRSAGEKAKLKRQLEDGQSIMDFVGESSKSLQKRLGPKDRQKLDEYFTNIRETERRLRKNRAWQDVPKPKFQGKPPRDVQDRSDFISKIELMYDMIHLAVESNSTRIITFNQPNLNDVLPAGGITQGYHSLSHHNGDPEKIRQLVKVETQQMKNLNRLLGKLKNTSGSQGSLLDESMVMIGSIFGDANTHNTKNMPIILAGGGFNHGQHLAFDRTNNTPTCNLYVSMLKQLGLEESDSFASSTGTLKGLEPRS
ncbi:MAG: DUF1552 domain-containing protein [Planctomycetota bacterium]